MVVVFSQIYVHICDCLFQKLEIADNYCGEFPINHPIAGTNPLSHDAIVHFPNSVATSMIVTVTHQFTVAFLGTQDGMLKKVRKNGCC